MIIDKTSFFLNVDIKNATATCPWGTSIGQSKSRDCRIDFDKKGVLDILVGMTYKSLSDPENVDISDGSSSREKLVCAKFDKVYVNDFIVKDHSFILTIVKEHSTSHDNRLVLSYAKYIKYRGLEINSETINEIQNILCKTPNGSWFIYDLSIRNQDELHLSAIVLDDKQNITYNTTDERSSIWEDLINKNKKSNDELDDDSLAKLLKETYDNAPSGMQVAAIHSFGIQYGGIIKNAANIINKSGLNTSYNTELSKGVNLYKAIRDKVFGLSFGNLENNLINLNYENKQISSAFDKCLSLQQIYYGAPGTGKSHEINEQTSGEEVIRTTFHPDSDYSTFVGAYKPTSKEIILRDDRGFPVKENGVPVMENRIVYEFVEQAFLQAYVNAWKFYAAAGADQEVKKQYLVIEEINRGNCAQIFGDLFQLLDRNESGFSEYPIRADNDMKKQLKKAFAGLKIAKADDVNSCYNGKDIVRDILEGECLLLPNNLYIWATMNTSDQSLFPIDSAFKRRWDWKYMPIDTAKENWTIRINKIDYSWTSFLNIINEIVHDKTQSEDKQLGFYFCKAQDKVIDAETFVGKVLFYLWNDVFKDYGFDDDFFKDEDLPDGTFKPLTFKSFYDVKTRKIIESQAEKFLSNLKVEIVEEMNAENDDNSEDESTSENTNQHNNNGFELRVKLDGQEVTADGDYVDVYLQTLRQIGLERVMNLGILCHGENILSKEAPVRYSSRTIDDYTAITFKLSGQVERILQEIKDKLSLDMEVQFTDNRPWMNH